MNSKTVFELEIWSRPGMNLDIDAGKELQFKITNELDLDSEIVLGLSSAPDKSYVQNLLIAINEGELSIDDFSKYCNLHDISMSIHDMKSAFSYLEYVYGRPLAWLHIPYNNFGLKIYNKILRWCDTFGYNVQEEDNLYCIIPIFDKAPLGW